LLQTVNELIIEFVVINIIKTAVCMSSRKTISPTFRPPYCCVIDNLMIVLMSYLGLCFWHYYAWEHLCLCTVAICTGICRYHTCCKITLIANFANKYQELYTNVPCGVVETEGIRNELSTSIIYSGSHTASPVHAHNVCLLCNL